MIKNELKKRVFITTGAISLINALTIIKQCEDDKEYDDILVVVSFSQSKEFMLAQEKIASIHNFTKILFYKKEKEVLENLNLLEYDSIYSVSFPRLYKYLNKHKNSYFFDEGPGYAVIDVNKFSKVSWCYISNFLGKFTFYSDKLDSRVKYINKEIFKSICARIIKLFNEEEKLSTDKNIIFIGHYIYRELGNDVAFEYYKKYINYFIEKGYNVYFKGHPRDNDIMLPLIKNEFETNKMFHILDNNLPIEIYDYNFDAVVGTYSGTLISMPHYWDIPAINIPLHKLYRSIRSLNYKRFFALYEYYTPSFEEMNSVIGKSKEEIYKKYLNILETKIILKQNNYLKKILKYKFNPLVKFYYVLLNILCHRNDKLLNYVFDKMCTEFYTMIGLNKGDKNCL